MNTRYNPHSMVLLDTKAFYKIQALMYHRMYQQLNNKFSLVHHGQKNNAINQYTG